MSFYAQLNLRSTAGYRTDGAGQTYVLGSDQYPTVRDGITFGWVGTNATSRDRSAVTDPRIAGVHWGPSGASGGDFRVDLPGEGVYQIGADTFDIANAVGQDFQVLVDDVAVTSRISNTPINQRAWDIKGNELHYIDLWPTARNKIAVVGSTKLVVRSFRDVFLAGLSHVSCELIAETGGSAPRILSPYLIGDVG